MSLCVVCRKETNHLCGKCRKVYYCSSDCQKSHWIEHKLECREESKDSKHNPLGLHVTLENAEFKKQPHKCYCCNNLSKFEELWRYCHCYHKTFPHYRGICKNCAKKYRGQLVSKLLGIPKHMQHHVLMNPDTQLSEAEKERITRELEIKPPGITFITDTCTFIEDGSGKAPWKPGLYVRNSLCLKAGDKTDNLQIYNNNH